MSGISASRAGAVLPKRKPDPTNTRRLTSGRSDISALRDCDQCDICRVKNAFLNCEDCSRKYCGACFGNAHLDPKKAKHTVYNSYSGSGKQFLQSIRTIRPSQSNVQWPTQRENLKWSGNEPLQKHSSSSGPSHATLSNPGFQDAVTAWRDAHVTTWKNPFYSDCAGTDSHSDETLRSGNKPCSVRESVAQTDLRQQTTNKVIINNDPTCGKPGHFIQQFDSNGHLIGLERPSSYHLPSIRDELACRIGELHMQDDRDREAGSFLLRQIDNVDLEPKGKDIERTAEVHRRNISRLLKYAGLRATGAADEKSRSKSLSPSKDLPAISVSKSSDNKRSATTTPQLLSPAATSRSLHGGNSRPKESMHIHRPLGGIQLATRMLDIDHLPRICITSTSNVDSLYNPRRSITPSKPVTLQLRSRSPSPAIRPSCALEHSKAPTAIMAVLRNEPVKKSPSLTLRPADNGVRGRSASFGREGIKSPSPVRSRAGSNVSGKKTLAVPYAPQRKRSPVMGARGSLSPSADVSRRPSLTPSTGSGVSAISEHEPHVNSRYERNLKKFYSWCQHCKRILRAQQQDPAKGLLNGNGSASKRISNPTVTRRLTTTTPSPSTSNISALQVKKDKRSAFGLYCFDSSDLPLKSNNMGLLHPHCCHNGPVSEKKDDHTAQRPKSAQVSKAQDIKVDKPKFQSLFNFDDALSLTPDQVDTTWMYDPLDSDDDFCYTIDVETMSVCSDTSIVASAITCDTKLKDDDEECTKPPLRKSYSSNK